MHVILTTKPEPIILTGKIAAALSVFCMQAEADKHLQEAETM